MTPEPAEGRGWKRKGLAKPKGPAGCGVPEMVVPGPKRYRLFQYSLSAEPDLGNLNSFFAAHRVALVTQHMVKTLGGGMLVEPVESSPTKPPEGNQARVDCREQFGIGKFASRVALRW